MVMANILTKVHQLPVIEGVSVLNIAEKAEHYWNMIAAAYGTKVLALKDGLQQLSGTPSGPLSLCHLDPTPGKDRKSTRLNSSHVRISYAVFCLKKKKKNMLNNY